MFFENGALLNHLEALNEQYFIPHSNQEFETGLGVHLGNVLSRRIKSGIQHHMMVTAPVEYCGMLTECNEGINNIFIVSEDKYQHTAALSNLKELTEPV